MALPVPSHSAPPPSSAPYQLPPLSRQPALCAVQYRQRRDELDGLGADVAVTPEDGARLARFVVQVGRAQRRGLRVSTSVCLHRSMRGRGAPHRPPPPPRLLPSSPFLPASRRRLAQPPPPPLSLLLSPRSAARARACCSGCWSAWVHRAPPPPGPRRSRRWGRCCRWVAPQPQQSVGKAKGRDQWCGASSLPVPLTPPHCVPALPLPPGRLARA